MRSASQTLMRTLNFNFLKLLIVFVSLGPVLCFAHGTHEWRVNARPSPATDLVRALASDASGATHMFVAAISMPVQPRLLSSCLPTGVFPSGRLQSLHFSLNVLGTEWLLLDGFW